MTDSETTNQMHALRRSDVLRRVYTWILIFMMAAPGLTGLFEQISGLSLEIPLSGYVDKVEEPEFSPEGFTSGRFQDQFTDWFDQELPLRWVMVRTYSTLRWHLFHRTTNASTGDIVGKDQYLYTKPYIFSDLAFGEPNDFSLPANRAIMEETVRKYEELQRQLQRHGKHLYFYIPTTKPRAMPEWIPDVYTQAALLSNPDAVSAVDLLMQLLDETEIPYLDCSELLPELTTPSYYRTGIHWSRPYEQLVSARIVDDLARISGKPYRRILLGTLEESQDPYDRDHDLYRMVNKWTPAPSETYYQYLSAMDTPESYEPLRMLLFGTSFSSGLSKDVREAIPTDLVYRQNRLAEIFDLEEGAARRIDIEDVHEVDYGPYLDRIDTIVIEVMQAEIIDPSSSSYFYALPDILLAALADYEPGEAPYDLPDSYGPDTRNLRYAAAVIPGHNNDTSENSEEPQAITNAWDSDSLTGFYKSGAEAVYLKPYAAATLRSPKIRDQGLEMEFKVPQKLLTDKESVTVSIYVNRKRVYQEAFASAASRTITLTPEELPEWRDALSSPEGDSELFFIEFCTDHSFVPAQLDPESTDKRVLSLLVQYVGEVR